jgi:hypothetical protein
MTDVADFAILASRYGFVAPGAGAGTVSPLIPEPTAGFLVGVGLLLACFGFRGARLRSGWTWPVVRLFAVPLVTLTLAPNAFAVQVVDDPLGRASTSISVQRSPVAGFLTYTVSVSPLSPMKEITSIDAAFTAPSMRQVSLFGPTVFTNLNFLFPLVGENPLSDSQFEYDNSPPVLSVFASESATSLAAAFTNFAPILSSQPIAHVVMPDGVVGTMNMTLVLRDIGVPGVGQTAIFSSVKFTAVPGDYNNDGLVDAADYVVWRKYVGTTTAIPNDPHGGTIGINQFNTWRSNFGTSLPGSGSGVSLVPEPGSFLLVLLAAGLTVCLCRLRIRAIRVPEVPGWRHSIAHQLL